MPKPFDVLRPAVTMLALAPSKVPFPPRQAPKLSAHAKVFTGRVSGSSSAKIFTTGIIVAVYGILSRNAEVIADTHKIRVMAKVSWSSSGWLLITLASALPIAVNRPMAAQTSTKTKRPAKKSRVSHST